LTDIATLQTWLDEARRAYHALQTGRLTVELRHGLKTIVYNRANLHDLRAYIAQLEAQIAAGAAYRPSGVGVIF
jgi:hypothetical protein